MVFYVEFFAKDVDDFSQVTARKTHIPVVEFPVRPDDNVTVRVVFRDVTLESVRVPVGVPRSDIFFWNVEPVAQIGDRFFGH